MNCFFCLMWHFHNRGQFCYVLVKSRAQAEQGFMRLRTTARLGLFTFQPTSFCFSQMHFLPPKLDYKLIFLPCSLALRSTILHRNWWKWFRWVIPQNMFSRERWKNAPTVLRLSPAALISNTFWTTRLSIGLLFPILGNRVLTRKAKFRSSENVLSQAEIS